ncbi:MAG: L,D-transpeptidase [Lachnospiraceae bacterium]|nr:L,D-transpeptidase [Lachnospiraceae bacterium]
MKQRTLLKIMILTTMWACLLCGQAFGYWIQDDHGWQFMRPDGSYITDAWEWIDGDFDGYAELYYFGADGYCIQDGMKHGLNLNEDGAWTYHGVVQAWNLKNLTGWYRLNGDTMYLEEEGNIWRERITPDNIYVDNLGWKVTESGIDEEEMAERSKDGRLIVISKSSHFLERWENGEKTHSFVISSGYAEGDKVRSGDMKTPEGEFYICKKVPNSAYYLALALNYPTIEDAKRGLEAGLITKSQYNSIVKANKNGQTPNWYTTLGGAIEIHGNRQITDATRGCVGMRNEDMKLLYSIMEVGDPVLILP